MDDLAVARGCLRADPFAGIDDENLMPCQCKRARHGKADNTGSSNNAPDIRHVGVGQAGIAVSTMLAQ